MNIPTGSFAYFGRCAVTALLLSGLVAACGGGSDGPGATPTTATPRTGIEAIAPGETSGAPPAWLNARTLQEAEAQAKATTAKSTPLDSLMPGWIAAWEDYASGKVAHKATAARIPVYRFYNRITGAHFYTNSETEKNNVIATMPNYNFDGVAFHAASAFSPGLSPVYRFYNTTTGVHFYTISETEKNNILATMPQFVLEGQAYHASLVAGQGLTPLYRFYVPSRGFHFYTASDQEKTAIQATLSSSYTYEGIGYYVLASNWTALKLPHSGVSASQCYQAGSSALGACGASGPLVLDNQQDGFRALYNPMSYSALSYLSGSFLFNYALTSCVKDNVTGLVWEGKEASGNRRGGLLLTNLGNGQADDTSGYIATVNASALCGYNDWRLPTVLELTTLQDMGQTGTPRIQAASFPNTSPSYYWTSEAYAGDGSFAWVSTPSVTGLSNFVQRTSQYSVRLVRGSMTPPGTRFSYTSSSYGSDASDNVVNDAWTGLQWRRCLEGQTWSGTTCTGAPTYYTHEQALAHDGHISMDRWRMPNIKEIDSLVDRSRSVAPAIHATAFPGAQGTGVWSTTPYAAVPTEAYSTVFNVPPSSDVSNRLGTATVRLILLP